MANETEREVYRALRVAQEKYAYFLLAAAGAAIALAVNQTREAALAWTQAPLGAAVLCWALSFFFGCMHLQYGSATLNANLGLLQAQSGKLPPLVGASPEYVKAAIEGISSAAEKNSNRGNRYGHWQFRCLVTGGVLYIVWHLLEMYLRSIPVASIGTG